MSWRRKHHDPGHPKQILGMRNQRTQSGLVLEGLCPLWSTDQLWGQFPLDYEHMCAKQRQNALEQTKRRSINLRCVNSYWNSYVNGIYPSIEINTIPLTFIVRIFLDFEPTITEYSTMRSPRGIWNVNRSLRSKSSNKCTTQTQGSCPRNCLYCTILKKG